MTRDTRHPPSLKLRRTGGTRDRLFALRLVLLSWIVCSCALAQGEEHWYSIQWQGCRIGYSHTGEAAVDDGYRVTMLTVVRLERGGGEINILLETRADLDADYRPLDFYHLQDYGGTRSVIRGVRQGNELYLTGEMGGAPFKRRVPLADDVLSGIGAMIAFRRESLELGREKTYKVFIEEMMSEIPITMKVTGRETLDTYRGKVDVFLVETDIKGVIGVDKIDSEGTSWQSTIPGLGFLMVKTSEKEARRLEGGRDIMVLSRVPCKGKTSAPRSMRRLSLRLIYEGKGELDLPLDARQAVKSEGKGVYLLDLKAGVKTPVLGAEAKDFLRPGPYEGEGSVEIAKKARKVTSGIENPAEKAATLNAWVYNYIADKDFSQVYAGALEVLATRRGDCTEHSILLSALLKAAGIPCRVVVGLALLDGAFWYHEWVEACFDGGWHSFDPTFGGAEVDAAHIKIAGISTIEGFFAASLRVARLLNQLEIEVLAVEY